ERATTPTRRRPRARVRTEGPTSLAKHSLLLGESHQLRSPKPARDDHGDADEHQELSGRGAVRLAAVTHRDASECHAERDAEHEPAGDPHTCLLRARVLAPLSVEDPILDQGGEASIEVVATQLVSDEQRLAGLICRWIREARLQ